MNFAKALALCVGGFYLMFRFSISSLRCVEGFFMQIIQLTFAPNVAIAYICSILIH